MADPFNNLITGDWANTLLAYSQAEGARSDSNASLAAGRVAASQNLASLASQRDASYLAERRQDRMFDLQQAQADREFAGQQTNSAFARLNESLDRQLKYAELESQERQAAFENSLKVQQGALQMKAQSMQLEHFAKQMAGEDLKGTLMGIQMDFSAGNGTKSPIEFSDEVTIAMKENKAGLSALAGTEEGRAFVDSMAGAARSARLFGSGAYNLDPGMVEELDYVMIDKFVESSDLAKRAPTDNERQALAVMARDALAGATEADKAAAAAEFDVSSANPSQVAWAVVRRKAVEKDAVPAWQSMATKLADPGAKARFLELHSTGQLVPVSGKEQLMRMQALEQSRMQTFSALMEKTGGQFLFSPEYKQRRQEFDDQIADARADILSGGDVRAKWALGGAISMDVLNGQVKEQAGMHRRSMQDLVELTGVPGALRTYKNLIFGGGKYTTSDTVDAVLLPFMFLGGGVAVKGATAIGKAALAKAGVKAFGGAAAKAGMRESAAAIGKNVLARRAALLSAKQLATRNPRGAANALKSASAATRAAWAAGGNLAVDAAVSRPAIMGAANLAMGIDHRELDVAAGKLGRLIETAKLDGAMSKNPRLMNEISAALSEYRRVAGHYFPGGEVPPGVDEALLSARNFIPASVLRQFQRDYFKTYGGSAEGSLSELLAAQPQRPTIMQGGIPGGQGPGQAPALENLLGGLSAPGQN